MTRLLAVGPSVLRHGVGCVDGPRIDQAKIADADE